MSDEWGSWVEHDGKGCPVPEGTFVDHMRADGVTKACPTTDGPWWHGGDSEFDALVRYRIRKPRALIELIDMVENLPAPQTHEVA